MPPGMVVLLCEQVVTPHGKPGQRQLRVVVDEPVRRHKEVVLLAQLHKQRDVRGQTPQVVRVRLQDRRLVVCFRAV